MKSFHLRRNKMNAFYSNYFAITLHIVLHNKLNLLLIFLVLIYYFIILRIHFKFSLKKKFQKKIFFQLTIL